MRVKSFVTGLVVGSLITATVSVGAANYLEVTALLTDNVVIKFNGEDIVRPTDIHVLNYKGSVYTPVRLISEKLGAEVTYDDDAKVVGLYRTEALSPAEPKVEQPRDDEEYDYEEEEEEDDYIDGYYSLPVKRLTDGITVNIFGVTRNVDNTYIHVDIANESQNYITMRYDEAMIYDEDGEEYPLKLTENAQLGNSLLYGESLDDYIMTFEPLPEDVRYVDIYLPFDVGAAYYNYVSGDDDYEEDLEEVEFEFGIDLNR